MRGNGCKLNADKSCNQVDILLEYHHLNAVIQGFKR
jgi:hypothetical protein